MNATTTKWIVIEHFNGEQRVVGNPYRNKGDAEFDAAYMGGRVVCATYTVEMVVNNEVMQ